MHSFSKISMIATLLALGLFLDQASAQYDDYFPDNETDTMYFSGDIFSGSGDSVTDEPTDPVGSGDPLTTVSPGTDTTEILTTTEPPSKF